jgi:hypothetical protein
MTTLLQQYNVPITNISWNGVPAGGQYNLNTHVINHETGTIILSTALPTNRTIVSEAAAKYVALYMQVSRLHIPVLCCCIKICVGCLIAAVSCKTHMPRCASDYSIASTYRQLAHNDNYRILSSKGISLLQQQQQHSSGCCCCCRCLPWQASLMHCI